MTCRRLTFSDVVFVQRLRKLLVPRRTGHQTRETRGGRGCALLNMPLTRSASRAAAVYDGMSTAKAIKSTKRTAEEPSSNSSKKSRFQKTSTEDKVELSIGISSGQQFLPATLKFSFEEGKMHLISVDGRFEELFERTPCKPFEQLETVHPFRCAHACAINDG